LQAPDEQRVSSDPGEDLLTPPLAPRPIPNRYVWRLVARDGGAIAAFVFGILGVVFSTVGAELTLGVITAFLGIPFLIVGVAFLIAAGWVFLWRYQKAQKVVNVLRVGQARRGQIIRVEQNYHVRIKGRFPWVIRYQFQVDGQDHEGKVSVLNQPGESTRSGKRYGYCICRKNRNGTPFIRTRKRMFHKLKFQPMIPYPGQAGTKRT